MGIYNDTDFQEVDLWSLQFYEHQTEAICLDAVRANGLELKDVKEQTPAICLEAVKENG